MRGANNLSKMELLYNLKCKTNSSYLSKLAKYKYTEHKSKPYLYSMILLGSFK